jgi:hypothetical protein
LTNAATSTNPPNLIPKQDGSVTDVTPDFLAEEAREEARKNNGTIHSFFENIQSIFRCRVG